MTIVQEKTTRVGGMTIFYREAGAGEPILLLHGVPTSSYLWRRLLPRLARFGRAVAPDHYGFGRSDKPAEADYSVLGYVRYLEGFTAALGLDRLHLIVHDFGGPFGLAFAITHPERIRSLVILNTIFYSDYEWHPLAQIWRTPGEGERLMAGWTRERFGRGMLKWLARPESLTATDLDAYYEPIADPAMSPNRSRSSSSRSTRGVRRNGYTRAVGLVLLSLDRSRISSWPASTANLRSHSHSVSAPPTR